MFLLVFLCGLCVGGPSGCKGDRPDGETSADVAAPSAAAAAVRARAIEVREGAAGLVYRYYDADARRMKTATSRTAVPESARARVVVFEERRLADYRAGEPLTVADLRTAGEGGLYPSDLIDPYAHEAALPRHQAQGPAPGAAAEPTASAGKAAEGADVILFSTDWCPHCKTARRFLESKGVKFVERNVEKDPKARPLLQRLGKEAGADPALLGSVPILWVKGRLILGFDRAEVEKAL